jgi:hypothetical protein
MVPTVDEEYLRSRSINEMIRERGKPKYLEKNRSQSHFVYHRSHMVYLGFEPEPPKSESGNLDVYACRRGIGNDMYIGCIHHVQLKFCTPVRT